MVGRVFKVIGLIGGGILAIGAGALGTHAAYPVLESNFFPERINREKKLNELLGESKKEVDKLANDLLEANESNLTNEKVISKKHQDLSKLNEDLEEKKRNLEKANQDLNAKEAKIIEQDKANKEQQSQITQLSSQVSEKDEAIKGIKTETTRIESNLNEVKGKLKLTKDDILKPDKVDMDLLDVNLRKVEFKSFGENLTNFEITIGNKKTQFQVKNGKLPQHESIAKHIRSHGIPFSAHKDNFEAWDKKIKVTRYDVDYEQMVTDPEKNRNYVKTRIDQIIDMKDYFKSQYFEDAFKVYMAIAHLDTFPLEYDTSSSSSGNVFNFSSRGDINFDFSSSRILDLKEFKYTKEDDRMFIFTHSFVTVDDFIKYWLQKTVEYIRTGTVDLLSFLSPITRSENYKTKN